LLIVAYSSHCYAALRDLHSFPTRRSSDLGARTGVSRPARMGLVGCRGAPKIAIREQGLFLVKRPGDRDFLSTFVASGAPCHGGEDRKSTRLNSSHRTISYAVFCLKKKKTQ